MTEKRFVTGDLWIQDRSSMGWTTYFLDEQKEVNELCDLINNLADENKQLKQQLQSVLKLTKEIEYCTHDIKLIGDLE